MNEVDEEIERVRNYNDDMIDVKLDDCIDGVKVELQEYVDDQFEGVEGRMMVGETEGEGRGYIFSKALCVRRTGRSE